MSQNCDSGNYINNNIRQIKFNLDKFAQVCKIPIHTGTSLVKNDVIFTMIDAYGQGQSFLSPISGTITKLYIRQLDIISYGSIIFEYEECRHTITFKNRCADCGIDLNQLETVFSTLNSSKRIIAMDPSFPQVTITRKEALRYDSEECNHLLRKRKLHLVVDLDQTLVHTTDTKNHYPSSPDVIAYQLNIPEPQTFYTKLRPGIKEFLTNLQSLYQFHIITFGDRPYANTIAKLIDPDKRFFSHRILSRDECLSLTDKTANLSSLFPSGDSLVCIIDDREDVWNYAPNLVHVKPYTWFRNVGDINNIYLPPLTEINQGNEKRKFHRQNKKLSNELEEHNNLNKVIDCDFYLKQLESILKRIHKVFYETYDQWMENKRGMMPDLKQLMPNIRRQILKSVSLCFSHLIPQNYPMEKHPAVIMAQAMGAKVTCDLRFDRNGNIQTTHVIAGKQTMKVYQALQNKIKVVTPEWLINCYEQWEKIPEENYILTPEYNVRKSRLFTEEIPRVSKRQYSDIQQQVSVVAQPILYQQTTVEQKRSYTNNNLSNSIPLENSFDQCNFNMSVKKRHSLGKEVNEFYINDIDESSDIHPRPSKRQCTMIIPAIANESVDVNDD